MSTNVTHHTHNNSNSPTWSRQPSSSKPPHITRTSGYASQPFTPTYQTTGNSFHLGNPTQNHGPGGWGYPPVNVGQPPQTGNTSLHRNPSQTFQTNQPHLTFPNLDPRALHRTPSSSTLYNQYRPHDMNYPSHPSNNNYPSHQSNTYYSHHSQNPSYHAQGSSYQSLASSINTHHSSLYNFPDPMGEANQTGHGQSNSGLHDYR
jgi:hypothetical protein